MTPDDLPARVARLEAEVQELRHSSGPAGLAFGLSLVQDQVAELRRETTEGFAQVNDRIDALAADLTARLDAVLARLDRA